MESHSGTEFKNQYFKSFRKGSLIVLEFEIDGFQTLLKIEDNVDLFNWFDFISLDKSIKGILIIGNEDSFGDVAYASHLAAMTGESVDPDNPSLVKKIIDSRKRTIQINMINTYIRKFIEMPKLIIIALTDCVVSPFWGISLAADYRIANPNLKIHLNSKEFGLHPSGGVPFFMMKQIGISRTQDLLYFAKYIDIESLISLGLINRVTSAENFRNDAISIASGIIDSTSYEYFYYTKQLINHKLLKEFDNYIELEAKMEMH